MICYHIKSTTPGFLVLFIYFAFFLSFFGFEEVRLNSLEYLPVKVRCSNSQIIYLASKAVSFRVVTGVWGAEAWSASPTVA